MKCHICGIEAPHNVLLAKHCQKHRSSAYSKADYKRDLLAAHGRPPQICPECNKETEIPKGEKDYPKYHRECYAAKIARQYGAANPNYRGGKVKVSCAECGKELWKHPSHLTRPLKFCSSSCSQTYYCRPENQTEAVKTRMAEAGAKMHEACKRPEYQENIRLGRIKATIKQKETLATPEKRQQMREKANSPETREKKAAGMARAFKNGCSKLEIEIFNKIKELMPAATNSEHIGFYVVDILIDKIVIEVQGDYWHTIPKQVITDKRKNTYLTNKGYKVIYIWEHEWHAAGDKEELIKSKLS